MFCHFPPFKWKIEHQQHVTMLCSILAWLSVMTGYLQVLHRSSHSIMMTGMAYDKACLIQPIACSNILSNNSIEKRFREDSSTEAMMYSSKVSNTMWKTARHS